VTGDNSQPGPPERGWYPPSRPLPADGIKARSKRGSIGEQWWSRRFIDVLESFGLTGRLQRGRRYARAGQVLDLRISSGDVSARVQGSRAVPYKVRIRVLPLTTGQWRRVEQALAAQALFRAKLLAGEMPAEIEDVFLQCGTPLFPRSERDLDMRCSCPDWGVPCKHLAAVCYVLAERFDDDPFQMLAWRGRGRDALLAALRAGGTGAAGTGAAGTGAAGTGPGEPARPVLDVSAPPLAGCLDRFWAPGLSQARLRALPAAPATPPDLLLQITEPPAVRVRGSSLEALLTPAYQRLYAANLPEPD
jgi:uncharacterized Zn finger protein